MKVLKIIFRLVCIILLLNITACKNKTAKPNPVLASIELKRGDLVLCYGAQFGDINFSISCDYSVRETFDLALALLHSFEYNEAEKAFVKVLDVDPECAMAYWGVAMSIYHAAWFPPSEKEMIRASKILDAVKSVDKGEKESDYIKAITAFYKDYKTLDHKTRAKKYEEQMEKMYLKYKDDTEAAIFYTLALYSTRDRVGKDYVNERKAGAILEALFKEQPNHPGIAHYIIHNYDNPTLASKALATARSYADIAPASSHAQHMPSHIFTRLGLWDESIESNVNSASSARCYAESSNMDGHWANELHAMGYLVYAYLQKGDDTKAKEQYEYMKTISKIFPSNIVTIAHTFASIPARIALENRQWENAANIEPHESELQWENYPWQKSLIHFARAIGSSHLKDFYSAEKELDILISLRQELVDTGNKANAKQVLIQIKITQGWLNFLKGKQNDGIALLQEAVEMEDIVGKHGITPGKLIPAREFLAEMLMTMNRSDEALIAYEQNLKINPNRYNGLYGAAVAAKQSGNQEKAKMYFEQLIRLTENSNSDRIEIEEARMFLEQKAI